MRVYLSSVLECEIPFEEKLKLCSNSYVLHSFAYYKPQIKDLMSACKDVLIDSGAFTFLAFYGVFDLETVILIANSTTLIEMLIALLDTPFLYFSRRIK